METYDKTKEDNQNWQHIQNEIDAMKVVYKMDVFVQWLELYFLQRQCQSLG